MEASVYGYKDIVELLLNQPGINLNAKDNNCNTALDFAKCFTEIVKLLEDAQNKA